MIGKGVKNGSSNAVVNPFLKVIHIRGNVAGASCSQLPNKLSLGAGSSNYFLECSGSFQLPYLVERLGAGSSDYFLLR